MKKKVLILAIAVLTAFAILSLAACNLVQVTGGDASISDDYNADTTQRNVNNIRTTGGYRITYRLTTESSDESSENTNETLILAAKNDVYYVKNSNVSEQYVDLSEEEYASVYTKGEDGWTLTIRAYDEDYTKADAKEAFTAFESYFIMYATLDEGLEKSSATVAGRACDRYSWGVSVNFIVSASAKSECCIDKETGICLKWAASASASGIGVDSGSGSANFECTEFTIGFTPTLPTGNQIVETVDLRVDLNGDGGDEDEGGEVIGGDEGEGEGEGAGGNGNVTATYSIAGDVRAAASGSSRNESVNSMVASGVSFSFEDWQGTECAYAAKGDIYYVKEGDVEEYYDFSDDTDCTRYYLDAGEWTSETDTYDSFGWNSKREAVLEKNGEMKDYLYGGEDIDETYFTKTTETRTDNQAYDVDVYVYSYLLTNGDTLTITVEKTYGVIVLWMASNGYDVDMFGLESLAFGDDAVVELPDVE